MFFRPRATIDETELSWVLEAWRWIDGFLGAVEPDDTLWLPSKLHFPPPTETGHAAALHDFALVKKCCAMATWPTRLVAQRKRPQLAATLAHNGIWEKDPGGTYSRPDGDTAVITYDPALIENRTQLIYTLAHELAHFAQEAAQTPPPGGEDFSELCTDLTAAHLGFGLFGCLAVVKTYDGDKAYMPEHLWSFVTALFCELSATPADVYANKAPAWVLSGIKKNRAYLAANPNKLAGLRP